MSDQYTDFSICYDLFMDNVPYEKWADDIASELCSNGIEEGLVLDLGCGTGTLTELLSDKGYDMIGIDSSEEMLYEAREKQYEKVAGDEELPGEDKAIEGEVLDESDDAIAADVEPEILYLCQDIADFELYGTVRAVVSTCDTFNYLTEPEQLLRSLKLVNNYLDPEGVLIFDMNAPEKYEEILSDNVFAENREEASFIWENSYDRDSKINEYALTLFIKDEDTAQYDKSEEYHYQRAYSRDEIKSLLDEAGFEIIKNFEEDLRMYYVVRVAKGRKLGNIG